MDLTSYRDEFPITKEYTFLSHASVSPLSLRVTDAIHSHLCDMQTQPIEQVLPQVFGILTEARQRIATLINAESINEIVLMPNTATAISTAANSLPLRAGDNVLVLDGDYPANIYPWMNLAHKGVLTKVVPQHNGGLDIERLTQRIDKRTRVIALSAVMFATGFRNDLAAVGQLCRDRGIYFVVDGIQALGALQIDVQKCQIDVLAAGSQKWLLSTPGSGFMYCRQGIIDDLEPGAYVGTTSVVDPENYLDYNFTLLPDAQRFNLGTPNIQGAAALNASLAMLAEIGAQQVEATVVQLADALINDLTERGYHMVGSTAPEHRSGIVVAALPQNEAAALCARLGAAKITSTVRGNGLRFAPHFYNTIDEMMHVGAVLGDRAATRS